VGVVLDSDNRVETQESLLELERLVNTLGGDTVARLVQSRHRIDPATYIGRGKADALCELVRQNGAQWVAVDANLSPAQARNLEKVVGVPVVDRCGVILNIFSSRARTAIAKMQVELAQLQYLLPRLKHQWTHLSRQQGGIGVRGIGEKQIELDRRSIRNRIQVLRKKLARVSTQRDTQRQGSRDLFRVALVGYTNSGKSTLLNALTEAEVRVEDKLFSTLDSKVANFSPPLKPTILISDTVGFIRHLPHSLVESFKGTLEEASMADLILHVVDLADRRFEQNLEVGQKVLNDLGVGENPRLLVFNKVDKLGPSKMPVIVQSVYKDALSLSAHSGEGLDVLIERILEFFDNRLRERTLEMAYRDGNVLSRLYETTRVGDVEYLDGRVRVTLKATPAELERIERLLDKEERP